MRGRAGAAPPGIIITQMKTLIRYKASDKEIALIQLAGNHRVKSPCNAGLQGRRARCGEESAGAEGPEGLPEGRGPAP